MTDFVYILHVDFDAGPVTHTKRLSFTDRSEAEKFRLEGEKRGYKVVHLNAKTAYTAEKAWRLIEDEKEHYRKNAAMRLDAEIKSMI
jgi:hypothetical protein